MVEISLLYIDHLVAPVGVESSFHVSWALDVGDEATAATLQEAFELELAKDEDFSDILLCRSESSSQQQLRLTAELKDICRYYLRLKVCVGGLWTAWKTTTFVSAYQETSHWQGSFITAERDSENGSDERVSGGTYLRRDFSLKAAPSRAFAIATALGLYRLFVNGSKVGPGELTPGWTSYHKRLLYQTYEVTNLMHEGKNALGVHLGAGWYKGEISFNHVRKLYGEKTAFAGALIVEYADGSREVIASGPGWKGSLSPVIFSEIYDGEIYDARLEQPGWSSPGFDESAWYPAELLAHDVSTLVAQEGALVEEIVGVNPVALITTPKGEQVVDFGQNLTGRCHLSVPGARAGDRVELRFFEVLDAEGNVYTDNLRTAKQTLVYICKGAGGGLPESAVGGAGDAAAGADAASSETYVPNFTYQGFRYAQVVSFPGSFDRNNITAYAMHSRMEPTGSFACSNPLLNRLWHNITWGMRGNFVDIPSDCPQRDERLGWTGDAQIFSATASYLYNTWTFYQKWLGDLAGDQTQDGSVAIVVPDCLTGFSDDDWLTGKGTGGVSGWGDAATVIPWNLYVSTGDSWILEAQYGSMKAWVEFMCAHTEAPDSLIFNYGQQLGDWLALDAEEGSYFGATPTDLTSTAYFAYSCDLLARSAEVLGYTEDAGHYRELYKRIRCAYHERFFAEDGSLIYRTQTAQVISLCFGLVPKEYTERVIKDLVDLIAENDGHLTCGFLGTPYILFALSDNGRVSEAYELLLKEDFPSWLYQVIAGATTVWEHWDGLKPDGSMWSADMNSFNHYAYGAVGEWLYKRCAGLEADPEAPGYRHFFVCPCIGGNLSWARTEYLSPYGLIRVGWELSDGDAAAGSTYLLHVEVPFGTHATVMLPGDSGASGAAVVSEFRELGPGSHDLSFSL